MKRGGGGESGRISVPVAVPFLDEAGREHSRTLAVAPAFSVMLEPGTQVIPVAGNSSTRVTVGVSYNLNAPAKETLRLEPPQGWLVEPSELPSEFSHRGEKGDFEFKVLPSGLREGRAQIRAALESGGAPFTEGYSAVTREDLDTFYLRIITMPVGTRVGCVCRHLKAEVGVIIFTRRNRPSLTFIDILNPCSGSLDGDILNLDGKLRPVMKLRDYGELLSR